MKNVFNDLKIIMVMISPIKRQWFLGYQDSVFKVHPNFFHTIFFCGIHSRKNAWRMHGKRIHVRICRGRLRKNSNYGLYICTGKFIQASSPQTFTLLRLICLLYSVSLLMTVLAGSICRCNPKFHSRFSVKILEWHPIIDS